MKNIITLSICSLFAFSAIANDNLETLIEKNITQTAVKAKVSADMKPNTYKTTVEFSESDDNSARTQLDLNNTIAKVTSKLKANKIDYSLSNFRTHKQYKTNLFTARQSVILESKDKDLIEELTTDMQKNGGKVISTSSAVSEEQKERQFNELFKKAYKKATIKADTITKTLGGTKYTITNMNYYFNNRTIRPMAMKTMGANSLESNIEIDNSDKEVSLEITLTLAILRD